MTVNQCFCFLSAVNLIIADVETIKPLLIRLCYPGMFLDAVERSSEQKQNVQVTSPN